MAVFCGFGFSVFSLLLAVVDYLMKRFGYSRYLSLKIGTNFKVFDLISFFIMDGYILEWCFYSCSDSFNECYVHQV